MSEKRLGGILVNLKDYLYKRLISNMISLKVRYHTFKDNLLNIQI